MYKEKLTPNVGKVAEQENYKIRLERENHTFREQVRTLQNDFRDFAVQSVYRQRQEMETIMKNQMAKKQLDVA